MKKILLFLLISGLLLTFTNCSKQKKNSFLTWEGKVLYLDTPAVGAIVTLKASDGLQSGDQLYYPPEKNKFEIANVTTDANGNFYIHAGEARKLDLYWVTVTFRNQSHGININGYSKSAIESWKIINIP